MEEVEGRRQRRRGEGKGGGGGGLINSLTAPFEFTWRLR